MMDGFGLTREEEQVNIHRYNHALFKNMMFFADMVWEINIEERTAVVLEDKESPQKNTTKFRYEDFYNDYRDKRVAENDRQLFEQYFSYENLCVMKEETSLDIHFFSEEGQWVRYRIVLTPSYVDNVLSRVYLSARNMQAEERRELLEYLGQQQFWSALVSNSYFYYTFDVSMDGVIHEDFLTEDGRHPLQEIVKHELPVSFEEFAQKWMEEYQPLFSEKQEENLFTIEYLREAFRRNERVINLEVKQKLPADGIGTEYMQMLILLTENPTNRHIYASVVGRSISAFRKSAIEDNLELKSSNQELKTSNQELKTSNLELKFSNRELKRTLSQEEQFRLASLSGSLMVYNINLTRNQIEDEFFEIVDGNRYPMLELVGLKAPCDFGEFCKRWSETKIPEESREEFLKMYNREYMLDAYRRGERHLEMEYETVIGRGIKVVLRNTVLLVEDQKNGDILATVSGKDVSAQRAEEFRQKEALREAYEAASNASSAKTDFLARMSHDIRTPMNAIVGMTAIAEANLDDRERVADCLQKIDVSSKNLLELLNDVLDMSKIESGKVHLQEEAFDLAEMLDEFVAAVKKQVQEKNQTFQTQLGELQHKRVIGDRYHLQQALMNVMSNAVKYTSADGTIKLSVSEKPTNKQRVGCYEFVFEDNGIGMKEDFLGHLFEPFTRADDRRVEKIRGTGLGMAITQNIVRMMNGTIKVESELDKGSKFTVTVFLKFQSEENPESAQREQKNTLDAMGENDFTGCRGLIVEDNDMNAEIAEEILKTTGMEIERACDGKEAVDMVSASAENYYDIIFMDIQMPVMNGYDSTRTIRALEREDVKKIPILALSANAYAEDVQASLASGMNEHIAKPLNLKRLSEAMNYWLRKTNFI